MHNFYYITMIIVKYSISNINTFYTIMLYVNMFNAINYTKSSINPNFYIVLAIIMRILLFAIIMIFVWYAWLGWDTSIGYDVWVYNRIALDFLNFGLANIYSWGEVFWYHKEPLRWVLYWLLLWLSPITEFGHIGLLQNMYFIQYVASSIIIYAISQEIFKNKWVALACALVFLLSIVQRNTYLLHYAKQSLSLVFWLLAWYLLLKKHNLTALLLLFATLLTHLHTSIFFFLIFFLYGSKLLKKVFIVLWLITLAYIVFLADTSEFLYRVFYTFILTFQSKVGYGWYFFDIKTFLETQLLALWSLVGLVWWVIISLIHKKDKKLVGNPYQYYPIVVYLFGWIWILLGLLNWQRTEIGTDVMWVFIIGLYLHMIIKNKLYVQWWLFIVICIMQLFALYGYYETIFSHYYHDRNLENIIVLWQRNKLEWEAILVDNSLYVNHSIGFLSTHVIGPGIWPFNKRSEEYRATRATLDNVSKCSNIAESYGNVFILSANKWMLMECGSIVDEEGWMWLGKAKL